MVSYKYGVAWAVDGCPAISAESLRNRGRSADVTEIPVSDSNRGWDSPFPAPFRPSHAGGDIILNLSDP